MIDPNVKIESFEPVFTKEQLEAQRLFFEMRDEVARSVMKATVPMPPSDRYRAVADEIDRFTEQMIESVWYLNAFTPRTYVVRFAKTQGES